jgi:hypothetical protein
LLAYLKSADLGPFKLIWQSFQFEMYNAVDGRIGLNSFGWHFVRTPTVQMPTLVNRVSPGH